MSEPFEIISKYYDKQFESKALMISFLLEEQPEKLYYGDYGEDDIHSVTKENKDGTIEYVKDRMTIRNTQ